MSFNIRDLSKDEYFYGHKACAGCGGSLAVRNALKVLGKNTVAVLPAGCMSAVGFNFPQLCFSNNAIISTFAGTAKTSRPCSSALAAVIKLPLLFGASIITSPADTPLIILFLAGK